MTPVGREAGVDLSGAKMGMREEIASQVEGADGWGCK